MRNESRWTTGGRRRSGAPNSKGKIKRWSARGRRRAPAPECKPCQHRSPPKKKPGLTSREPKDGWAALAKLNRRYVLKVSMFSSCASGDVRWQRRGRLRTAIGISSSLLTTARQQPLYMTTHPQHPFFSWSSSMPILPMPFDWPPAGAPVYDDISLLYLRISRTMS